MFKFNIAILLFAVLFFASQVQAQDPQDEPIKLKSDLVMVTASVIDRTGRVMKSLKADDFTIYEDGVKQRIEHFASTAEPFTLMLLLDLSGSTQNDLALIKQAAKNFIAELRAQDKVAVIIFSGEVELIADFKDSRESVLQAIEKLAPVSSPEGYRFSAKTGTSFYDAMFLAVEDSPMKTIEGRKAIVCMSDGVDSTSKMDYADISQLVEKSEASVYFLELNTEAATLANLLKDKADPAYLNFSPGQINRYYDEYAPEAMEKHLPRDLLPKEEKEKINIGLYKIARRDMKELAERTGGREYPVRTLNDLSGVYKQVADDLRAQYSIGYYPTNDKHDSTWRAIKVESKKGGTVRARSGYWAK
ncbi:MAG: VWA domain-containing protein [Acidobacteriota bacterium]